MEEDQHKYFSMFGEDSLPKGPGLAEKNENGISSGPTKKTWKKRHYTIPVTKVKSPTVMGPGGGKDSTGAAGATDSTSIAPGVVVDPDDDSTEDPTPPEPDDSEEIIEEEIPEEDDSDN